MLLLPVHTYNKGLVYGEKYSRQRLSQTSQIFLLSEKKKLAYSTSDKLVCNDYCSLSHLIQNCVVITTIQLGIVHGRWAKNFLHKLVYSITLALNKIHSFLTLVFGDVSILWFPVKCITLFPCERVVTISERWKHGLLLYNKNVI